MLSKEGAITALVVFPLVGWTFFKKSWGESLKNSWWILLPVVLFFILRGAALAGLVAPAVSAMDNPIVEAHNLSERWGTAFAVMAQYFGLLFFPITLISDYTYNVVPLQGFGTLGSIAGLVGTAGLLVYAAIGLPKRSIGAFAALAFLGSIALYSQLPMVIGTLMGERLLYSPSLWFCLGILAVASALINAGNNTENSGFQWNKLSANEHRLLGLTLVVFLLFSVKTVRRNTDWKDNYHLFLSDVEKAPNSVRLNDGSAEELYKSVSDSTMAVEEKERRLQASEQHSRQSLSIKPGVSAYINLGNLSFYHKNFPEAVSMYSKALEIVPNYNIPKQNLINTLLMWARQEGMQNNDPAKAREVLSQLLKIEENNAAAWNLMGISYGVQQNFAAALPAFEKAYALNPTDPTIKQYLANTYRAVGMPEKADALGK
ncbi:MAG: tetratricopeptide repeat protein [Lewinellaceae bacterium]|nr:tetratricopeptide repeat protein [Lewinellaceae bacterium]